METGTVGTVFQEPNAEPKPSEPFFRNRNQNRNCAPQVKSVETKRNCFPGGSFRTQNPEPPCPSNATEPNWGYPVGKGLEGFGDGLGSIEVDFNMILTALHKTHTHTSIYAQTHMHNIT